MPFTSNKGFSTQATGTNAGTWGSDSTTPTANSSTALNEGVIELIDQAFAGITTLNTISTNVTLTQAQAQNCMFRCYGTLTANLTIEPDVGVLFYGLYCFENITAGSFTLTLQNAGGSVVLPQSRRCVVFVGLTDGPRIVGIAGATNADPVPVGTVMLFYQNAAPTGWTISAALNDYALKIVSSAGGVTSGSVAYSTLFGRTATDSHVLTTSEIPSHTHTSNASASTGLLGGTGPSVGPAAATTATSATGGGDGHTHDIDMRVQTASIILATKN